jgi:hypothetical protein
MVVPMVCLAERHTAVVMRPLPEPAWTSVMRLHSPHASSELGCAAWLRADPLHVFWCLACHHRELLCVHAWRANLMVYLGHCNVIISQPVNHAHPISGQSMAITANHTPKAVMPMR